MDRILTLLVATLVLLSGCASSPQAGRQQAAEPMQPPPPTPVASQRAPAASFELDRIDGAIQRFAHDRAGRLPVTLDELASEKAPDGMNYIRTIGRDPWGRPFSYTVTSVRVGAYDLRSYGPDAMPGTDDDVVAAAAPVMPR